MVVGMAPRSRRGSSQPHVSHCSKPTSSCQPLKTAWQYPSSSESAHCRVWVQIPTSALSVSCNHLHGPQCTADPEPSPCFCCQWFAALGEGRLADMAAAQRSQTLSGNRFFSMQTLVCPTYGF